MSSSYASSTEIASYPNLEAHVVDEKGFTLCNLRVAPLELLINLVGRPKLLRAMFEFFNGTVCSRRVAKTPPVMLAHRMIDCDHFMAVAQSRAADYSCLCTIFLLQPEKVVDTLDFDRAEPVREEHIRCKLSPKFEFAAGFGGIGFSMTQNAHTYEPEQRCSGK